MIGIHAQKYYKFKNAITFPSLQKRKSNPSADKRLIGDKL